MIYKINRDVHKFEIIETCSIVQNNVYFNICFKILKQFVSNNNVFFANEFRKFDFVEKFDFRFKHMN